MTQSRKGIVGTPFYASLLRELLLATLQSDPAVKVNFRALDPRKQERIVAEVDRISQELGKKFETFLVNERVDPKSADIKALRSLAHRFLREVSAEVK